MRNFIRHNIENVKGSKMAVSIQKETKRSPNKSRSVRQPQSIHTRIQQIESKLDQVQNQHQDELMSQLRAIKDDIRLIKSHLFSQKSHYDTKHTKQDTHQSQFDDEEEGTRMKSHSSEVVEFRDSLKQSISKVWTLGEYLQSRGKRQSSNKGQIILKSVASILKDYKLEGPERGSLFYGYSKRNSQPVVVKYFKESVPVVLEIYDRLWKSIAMAKWPCINKVLDFKDEDCPVIVMERNKASIVGLPPKSVVLDILKILQFIHQCGYLYRNMEPDNFMLNEKGQLVIIDFKRARRYVDVKGHQLEVQQTYNGSQFASNSQIRQIPEGRKDDLESLGYLALLLLSLNIPWIGCSREQTVKIRSGLVLQQLYKGHPEWVSYMAVVLRLQRNEKPDYRKLGQILENS